MADQKKLSPKAAKATTAGLLTGAVIAGAMALIQPWEGTKLDPYRDIVGIWTVCTGETRVEMRRYTRPECDGMLSAAIRDDYGAGVLKAVPALQHQPHQLIASISLAYNIGVKGFAGSTVARRFNSGNWRAGCDAFLMWNKAGGKVVRGLTNRREAERKVCLTGLP